MIYKCLNVEELNRKNDCFQPFQFVLKGGSILTAPKKHIAYKPSVAITVTYYLFANSSKLFAGWGRNGRSQVRSHLAFNLFQCYIDNIYGSQHFLHTPLLHVRF